MNSCTNYSMYTLIKFCYVDNFCRKNSSKQVIESYEKKNFFMIVKMK